MTKPVDTDERNLDEMLEALAKPKPLEHKEKGDSSQGRDAVEYHAAPHTPVARADHNTFPDAPIIVNQTNPGVAPPANPLNITPEERKKLDEELELRRKKRERQERNAETAPRRTNPPAVASDPARIPKKSVVKPLVVFALAVLLVAGIGVAMHAKSSPSSAASTSTSSTAQPPVRTSVVPSAPTHVVPTAPETITTPMTTAHATATHTNVAPPPTVKTAAPTGTAPTATAPTATTVAPPDLRGTN